MMLISFFTMYSIVHWKHTVFSSVKGSLTRDFRLQVFFHKSVSLWPLSIPLGPFQIFSKSRGDIFANECLSAVSTTPAKKEKNFEIKFSKIFS
jgi:hypothetical protein